MEAWGDHFGAPYPIPCGIALKYLQKDTILGLSYFNSTAIEGVELTNSSHQIDPVWFENLRLEFSPMQPRLRIRYSTSCSPRGHTSFGLSFGGIR